MSLEIRVLPLKGYEDTHLITTDGRVFRKTRLPRLVSGRILRGNWLKPCNNARGYLHYAISVNGRALTQTVHRLVAKTFLPNPDNLPEVNHKNGNKKDNRVGNLEWCTSSHNSKHSFANGLQVPKRGEQTHSHKLTRSDTERIKQALEGGSKQAELAETFGVNQSVISRIKNNKAWRTN